MILLKLGNYKLARQPFNNKALVANFIVTSILFFSYWVVTIFFPSFRDSLFSDYANKDIASWNWSFLPLNFASVFFGFLSFTNIYHAAKASKCVGLVSMVLTFSSGLMAISFWVINGNNNLLFWLPNLYLIAWPIMFIPTLICEISSQ